MIRLVLIGGGHSHAIALNLWAMGPIPSVHLTLISDTIYTPYSGMLPAYVAGFYSFEETHIDLRALANKAQAELYLDRAIGLDLEKNQVLCANHDPVSFDYLSIDIGSTPNTVSTPGAARYAIPVKPVREFLTVWDKLIEDQKQTREPLTLSLVGGGAGGVELALNMHPRLSSINADFRIHLFHQVQELLPAHNQWVQRRLKHLLKVRGIQLHLGEKVKQVEENRLTCESGLSLESNFIFWVTQASAPNWIKMSGLRTDEKGFILVGNTLQSLSHPHIFAAGDIATIEHYPRPKAGVFAVRQGRPLWENLKRIILGQPLKLYYPQKRYLSLIGTGDKKAIASWDRWGCQSSLLWHWKDHIDRQFMEQFNP